MMPQRGAVTLPNVVRVRSDRIIRHEGTRSVFVWSRARPPLDASVELSRPTYDFLFRFKLLLSYFEVSHNYLS